MADDAANYRRIPLEIFNEGKLDAIDEVIGGTMSGAFMGMPPSGKSATWDEVHIGRMADGKLAEHWGVIDRLGMMQQLGFMPGPGA